MKTRLIVGIPAFFCVLIGCGDAGPSSDQTDRAQSGLSSAAVPDPQCGPNMGRPVTCENETLHRAQAVSGDVANPCPTTGYTYKVLPMCCPTASLGDSVAYSHRVLHGGAVACAPLRVF